jgi:hypothetical protein
VVIDTSQNDPAYLQVTEMQTGNYNPFYIGLYKDTVFKSPHEEIPKYFAYPILESPGMNEGRFYKWPDSAAIALFVDTTRTLSHSLPLDEDDRSFKSYPVTIVNDHDDTINIGYGDHIPVIMEALDTNGQWKPIEEQFVYMCGTGLNRIILPPGNIVVTYAFVYKGNYRTKLRLRYVTGKPEAVSNEFYGSINRTQFKNEMRIEARLRSI